MTEPSTTPCCGEPEQNTFRGAVCRCCGERLRGEAGLVFCDRRAVGPCPDCGRLTCGPHGNDDRGTYPPRRYCEFDGCGRRCDGDGRCPAHGHREMPVRPAGRA